MELKKSGLQQVSKMKKEKLFAFIFLIFLLVIFISGVYALTFNEATDYVKTNVVSGYDQTKNFLFNNLGFNEDLKQGFFPSFLVGFFAGFWIWLVYMLLRLYRLVVDKVDVAKLYGEEGEELRESRTKWLYLIGGKIWKVVIIGIAYWVLMQIPVLNNIIRTVTLDVLGVNWLFRSWLIAFYIGFLPGLIEYFIKLRIKTKYEKGLNQAIKGARINQAQGRIAKS